MLPHHDEGIAHFEVQVSELIRGLREQCGQAQVGLLHVAHVGKAQTWVEGEGQVKDRADGGLERGGEGGEEDSA